MTDTSRAADRAAGRAVGVVAEVWRFPVKSFQGEQVERVGFDAHAMDGDRRYAVRDQRDGKVWSAKRHGSLLDAWAVTDGGDVRIGLPTGATFLASSPDADAHLAEWLGGGVHLDRVSDDPTAANGVYEFAFDIDDDPDAEWFDIDTPAGSFADLAHVHVLTTASIAAAAGGHPDGEWDSRRFRPSVLIDTGDAAGFVEDEWLGRDLEIGSLVVHVDLPTIRCVMPTRPQPALGAAPALVRDKQISRTIADLHGFNLGAYTSIVTPGEVAVGDEVVVW
ncbi:MAG TPA: MOSC N-terminal beta barrel domain-containing protein [Acidimicrobiales bacterium]|jgi:uncharacterized protein YcbX|nr:MOSC N-terminal beta barrel domain-containing protein [Acidimicrobiales bacterium]